MISRFFLYFICRFFLEYVFIFFGLFLVFFFLFRVFFRFLFFSIGRGVEVFFFVKRFCVILLGCGFFWDFLEFLRLGFGKIVIILLLKRFFKFYFIIVNFFVYNIL